MRNVLRVTAVIGAFVLCAASATPYQQKGLSGGYEDQDLGGNKHLITVNVNSYTSSTTAMQYAYRRAGELCPQGYDEVHSDRGTEYTGNGQKGSAVLVIQCKVAAPEPAESHAAAELRKEREAALHRKMFCASNATTAVCVHDKNDCEAARTAALGAVPDLGPCMEADDPWCAADHCFPSKDACAAAQQRAGSGAPECVESK